MSTDPQPIQLPSVPEASPPPPPPPYKLYTPGAVAWATAFGSPIAGCIILAMNYRRLGQRRAANKALVLGTLATIVIIILALVLPDSLDRATRYLSLGILLGMLHLSKQLLGPLLKIHQEHGGQLGSRWVGVGIGSIFLVLIVGVILAAVLLQGGSNGPDELPLRFALPSGQHEVLYAKDVSQAQAKSLHDHLRKIGFFIDGHPASFGLSREKDAYVLWIIVGKQAAAKPLTRLGFQSIAREVLAFLGQKKGTLRLLTPELERLGDEDINLLDRQGGPETQPAP